MCNIKMSGEERPDSALPTTEEGGEAGSETWLKPTAYHVRFGFVQGDKNTGN